jgi:hypothetical protein
MIVYIPKPQMSQKYLYDFNFFDKADDFHWPLTFWTYQGIHLIHFLVRNEVLALLSACTKVSTYHAKEQEGQIRDLRNRLFGKKARKKIPVQITANQSLQNPNVLVVSNPVVRDMNAQSVSIFPKKKKRPNFQKIRYVRIVANRISPMKARMQKLLKLKSKPIRVK